MTQDPPQQQGDQDLTKLQADLDAANTEIAQLTETAKHALADLQNYRRQVEKERSQMMQFATVNLLLDLLPVLDNFGRAFSQVPEEVAKTEWFKGALQIEQQLIGIMRKQGLTEMPSTVGQKIDPHMHEAVTTGPGEKDVIIAEFEKGYLLGGKVIRPAKVQVGNGAGA